MTAMGVSRRVAWTDPKISSMDKRTLGSVGWIAITRPIIEGSSTTLRRISSNSLLSRTCSCGELAITKMLRLVSRSVTTSRCERVGQPVRLRITVDFPELPSPITARNGFICRPPSHYLLLNARVATRGSSLPPGDCPEENTCLVPRVASHTARPSLGILRMLSELRTLAYRAHARRPAARPRGRDARGRTLGLTHNLP